jgi:hypothetical protein
MKNLFLSVFFILISLNSNSQEFISVSNGPFFEIGISYSPNGKYFAMYKSFKNKDALTNSSFGKGIYLSIIKVENLLNDSLKDKEELKIKIGFPNFFLSWIDDSSFCYFNNKTKLIYQCNLINDSISVVFRSIEPSFNQLSTTELLGCYNKIRMDANSEDFIYYNSDDKCLICSSLKTGFSKSILIPKLDNEDIERFAISANGKKVIIYTINERLIAKFLLINLSINSSIVCSSEEFDLNTKNIGPQLILTNDNEILFTQYSNNNSKDSISLIKLALKTNLEINLVRISTNFIDLLGIYYSEKSLLPIAIDGFRTKEEMPDGRIVHDNKYFDALTLLTVMMIKP